MQQNEKENVVEKKLQFANDATQFHTPKIVQYTMPRIPKIEEELVGYRMSFEVSMEP
jgi:hypothetical protein